MKSSSYSKPVAETGGSAVRKNTRLFPSSLILGSSFLRFPKGQFDFVQPFPCGVCVGACVGV